MPAGCIPVALVISAASAGLSAVAALQRYQGRQAQIEQTEAILSVSEQVRDLRATMEAVREESVKLRQQMEPRP